MTLPKIVNFVTKIQINSTKSCPNTGTADNKFVITVAKSLIYLLFNQETDKLCTF